LPVFIRRLISASVVEDLWLWHLCYCCIF